MHKFLPILLFSGLAFGQADLPAQVRLVKTLVPSTTKIALFFNPGEGGIDAVINQAAQENGVQIVKAPVKSIREVSATIRTLARYNVDGVIILNQNVVSSSNAIKFVVKSTVKKKTPVFTASENGMNAGAYGQFVKEGTRWRLKINGKVSGRFDITPPEGDDQFFIE